MAQPTCLRKLYRATEFRKIYVGLSGKTTHLNIPITTREPTTLTFMLFDCNDAIGEVLGNKDRQSNDYAVMAYSKLNVDIRANHKDGSHLDYDEQQCIVPLVVLIILIIVLMGGQQKYLVEEECEWCYRIVFMATVCLLGACCLQLLHYGWMGMGRAALTILSAMTQIMATFSQYTVCMLLLCVAQGYSIDPMWLNQEQLCTLWVGMVLVGLVKYMVVLVDRASDVDHYRFNDYTNLTAGILLIIFRVTSYLYFLFCLAKTSPRLKDYSLWNRFRLELLVVGSLYFLQGLLVMMVESLFQEAHVLMGILVISVGTNLVGLVYLTRMTSRPHTLYDRLRDKQVLPMS